MTTPVVLPDKRRWWVAAVVLMLIGAGCLGLGLRGNREALAGPPAIPVTPPSVSGSSEPAADGAPSAPAPPAADGETIPALPGRADPPVERSAPLSLRVPAIGLTVSLSQLGLNSDGTVEVPSDFQQAGWFRLGPSPGQVGSAVILGHVDSYQGPAVFFELRSLQAGDQVNVTLGDGAVAHFVVDTVAMYPKEQFPAEQVYASHGYSALQLVTCGGEFDTSSRSYLSNVVAYTSLVSVTPPAAPLLVTEP